MYSKRIVEALEIEGAIRVSPLHCNSTEAIDEFLRITQKSQKAYNIVKEEPLSSPQRQRFICTYLSSLSHLLQTRYWRLNQKTFLLNHKPRLQHTAYQPLKLRQFHRFYLLQDTFRRFLSIFQIPVISLYIHQIRP